MNSNFIHFYICKTDINFQLFKNICNYYIKYNYYYFNFKFHIRALLYNKFNQFSGNLHKFLLLYLLKNLFLLMKLIKIFFRFHNITFSN